MEEEYCYFETDEDKYRIYGNIFEKNVLFYCNLLRLNDEECHENKKRELLETMKFYYEELNFNKSDFFREKNSTNIQNIYGMLGNYLHTKISKKSDIQLFEFLASNYLLRINELL